MITAIVLSLAAIAIATLKNTETSNIKTLTDKFLTVLRIGE